MLVRACVCALSSFSRVQLFALIWTVAHQTPLSFGFYRQEYWSGLPFPFSGDLPDTRIKPMSSEMATGFFTTDPSEKPYYYYFLYIFAVKYRK